jgi:predicted TIM-barrel fold metal-dependent hydrolase
MANAQLAQIVARDPRRLTGFAMVHCARDGGRILEMLRRAVSRYGFRRVKVHGHEAMPTRELCEAARPLHLPSMARRNEKGACKTISLLFD